jgi:hypothetical protein
MAFAALILAIISIFLHIVSAASRVIGMGSIPKVEIVLKDEREEAAEKCPLQL